MILAYTNGTLIIVHIHKITTQKTMLIDADGKKYCYRESNTNRKLFDGENAVYDAIAWIGSLKIVRGD
jgi:hypothetical protein